jgi:predicted transglutaminase-like cysteine proteinase
MKDLARKIHKLVKEHFIWKSDQEIHGVPEHWKSYADEVEQGQVFYDDCDAFSLSCAELLTRQEADPAKVRIAFCRTETGGGHLVCVAEGWVLDNRQRDIIKWDKLPYKWVKSMRMDEPGIWRKAE